ncbi:histone-fold-containing protein [Linnemannia elongata]|nr:histone-fold-containing protein [Linnemannia elongata]
MHPPIYPMLSFMTHAPPPLQHHHDPSMAHHQPMQQAHMHLLHSFWMRQMHEIQNVPQDFKVHHLPLARIKKVMKTDDDVKAKMISADAPMIFDKGCDIFITELTLRAWIHAEENKRRTLQRSDIAAAIAKTDMFDFLIDIVPREEYKISLPKEHKTHHDLAGPDRRRSQEIFQPLPGPTGATGPRRPNNGAGIGGGMDANNLALDNYSYPFGILDQGDFTLASNAPEIIDPYQQNQQSQQQQQLQAQYMARQSQQFQ